MPGTGHLGGFPGTSEVIYFRKSELLQLYQISVIPYYILNHLFLLPTHVATTPHENSLSLQQMGTTKENYDWTQCKDQWILRSPAPVETSESQLLHL